MSNNSYTLGQLKKIEKIVVKDSANNIEKVVFPNDMQVGAGSDLPSKINAHTINTNTILVEGDITATTVNATTFSGSLTQVSDGSSYLIAGSNITITTGSNGSVTIESSGGGGGGGSGAVSSVANGDDNRVATFSGADSLNGEANLNFNGSELGVTGSVGVKADISGDFAVIIDNDQSSSGHGLKVTSDGTGSGTNIFDVESASDTIMRVRGDGRVGIGKVTSLPSARLTVDADGLDADISIAKKIQHIADDDTSLEFGTDTVIINAGNKSMIDCDNFGGTGHTKVLIMSGGAETAYDEASAADVSFYVSGSNNTRGTSTRGTSVFGGDLVVSGSLFTLANPGAVYLETSGFLGASPGGNPTADFHFEWHDGGVTNEDIEDFRNADYWKYFPHGGEIINVLANGSNVGNGSASNPFTGQMKVKLFTFTDAMVADVNPHSAGVIGEMTASPSAISATPDGGSTYKHRALFDFSGASVTGTFVIPPGQLAALSFQGIGGGNSFAQLHIHVVYKRNLK